MHLCWPPAARQEVCLNIGERTGFYRRSHETTFVTFNGINQVRRACDQAEKEGL